MQITHETLLIIIALVSVIMGTGGLIAYIKLRPDLARSKAETAKLQAEADQIAASMIITTAKNVAEQLAATAEASKRASEAWIALVNAQTGEIKSLSERLDRHKERIEMLEKQHEQDEVEIEELKRLVERLREKAQ
jgi:predicted RNase H-like nuclease (RuvC/YqgF family)